MENEIFKNLLSENKFKEILFAGVEIYTWHYKDFFKDKNFHTIDCDPHKRNYGNGDLHKVGSVCDLTKIYERAKFEAVIFNGLVGYGLNSAEDVNTAICEAYHVLADGGLLIIGWNNTKDHLDFALEHLQGYELFEEFVPAKLGLTGSRLEMKNDNMHTFDFLIKK